MDRLSIVEILSTDMDGAAQPLVWKYKGTFAIGYLSNFEVGLMFWNK